MEFNLRNPSTAAVVAAAATIAYVYSKSKMNNEGKLKNSDFMKPAFLIGVLVYFITDQGHGTQEALIKEPF